MISRFLLLVPSFTTKEVFKQFMEFFNNMQMFHQLFSMLYTGNLDLRYCVGFLQIRSHILMVTGKVNSRLLYPLCGMADTSA